MSDQFDLTAEEQQNNLEEFMETHGPEGFFTVYFRQLLYRFVKQELKSATEDIDGVGEQLYFTEDGKQLLSKHREELLDQCEVHARELVDDLLDHPTLGPAITNGDIEAFDQHQKAFTDAVHECFEDWKADGIRLLDEVESSGSEEIDDGEH
ncbi:hypothetical protein [Halorubrum sp. SD683]|uniref:hypothetical protein n=1 Tax=Halorubrum sp. SD683 TaxID=1855873 RepID=UPI000A2DA23B|nr:hypothetical protein [Halorubrum sp. SD683]OTF01901.1 hypothetical protein B9G49_01255 [Halorubrum sp. SD683]